MKTISRLVLFFLAISTVSAYAGREGNGGDPIAIG